jgi:flagellar basal-body rod modification protein FlgD
MTSVAAVPPPTAVPSGATSAAGRLGQEEFLRILVTQLQHQDPLNPLDGAQFAAELAQFSSLEQLINLNGAVRGQSEQLARAGLTADAILGATVLGRQVTAAGDRVELTASGRIAVEVEVGGSGGTATVQLLDAGGRVVLERQLGPVTAGRQVLTWSLAESERLALPPGVYRYAVTVRGADGLQVPVTTYQRGVVDGWSFDKGQVVLHVGALRIPLSQIVAIESVASSNPEQEISAL